MTDKNTLSAKHEAVLRKAADAVRDRGHEGDARLADSINGIIASLSRPLAPTASSTPSSEAQPLTRCAAARDGDCTHPQCPQLRDGEPRATDRHCPLDTHSEED